MQETYVGLPEVGIVGYIRGIATVVGNISIGQAKSILDDGNRRVLEAVTDERRRYVDSTGVSLLKNQQASPQEYEIKYVTRLINRLGNNLLLVEIRVVNQKCFVGVVKINLR